MSFEADLTQIMKLMERDIFQPADDNELSRRKEEVRKKFEADRKKFKSLPFAEQVRLVRKLVEMAEKVLDDAQVPGFMRPNT